MNGTSNQNKFSALVFLAAENEFRPMLRGPDPFHVYKIYTGVEPVVAHLESLAVAFARGNSGGSTSTRTSNEMPWRWRTST